MRDVCDRHGVRIRHSLQARLALRLPDSGQQYHILPSRPTYTATPTFIAAGRTSGQEDVRSIKQLIFAVTICGMQVRARQD